jgi:RyR domain
MLMRPMYRYSNEQVARICHEANRALQYVQEDSLPSVPWDAESPEVMAGTTEGVAMARQGTTPRESHWNWVRARIEQGWERGDDKDPERKTHPNLVSYEALPADQKDKDRLFLAIVTALTCTD